MNKTKQEIKKLKSKIGRIKDLTPVEATLICHALDVYMEQLKQMGMEIK